MNITSPSKTFVITVVIALAAAGTTILIAQTSGPELEEMDSSYLRLLSVEDAKQRFVGDIGGIFIAPDDTTPVPEEYTSYKDVCGDFPTIPMQWGDAGQLDLRVELPKKYELVVDDMNTGVVGCKNVAYAARRFYRVVQEDREAFVVIGRSILEHDTWSLAHDRLELVSSGGRQVILANTLTSDGSVDMGLAWIPESFGTTFITSSGLPRKDFLELVALIASTTRSQ